MEYFFEVYEENGYFGYRILYDGEVVINQPHAPAVNGLVRMKESEAIAMAKKVTDKLNDKRSQEEEAEMQALFEKESALTKEEEDRVRLLISKGDPTLSLTEVNEIIKKQDINNE